MMQISEQDMMEAVEYEQPEPGYVPNEAPLSSTSNDTERHIVVAQNRVGYLRSQWNEIVSTVIEILALQVRFNTHVKRVEIRRTDQTPLGGLQRGEDFIVAILYGFELRDAQALLRMDQLFIDSFNVCDVKPLTGDHISRAIGRVVGKDGQTKFAIENTTRTRIVVAGKYIRILGTFTDIKIARRAISELILGSPPGKVYSKLKLVANSLPDSNILISNTVCVQFLSRKRVLERQIGVYLVETSHKMNETPMWKKFVFGGIAGSGATVIVQPLDLVKTRLQLSGEGGAAKTHNNAFSALRNIIRTEGASALYRGLSAALFRQATYSTTRFGVYQVLLDKYGGSESGGATFTQRLLFGGTAGGIGAIVGTPAEVALIRMTSDGRLPVDQRRNYRHVFHALSRVTAEEGVLSMWRGVLPTMGRAIALNAAQLGTYSQAKALWMSTAYFNDSTSITLHASASMVSGLVCTAVSLPIDITKTRLQTMTPHPVTGVMPYTSAIDCCAKLLKAEGIFSLWKGFTPYFFRLGPHTVFSFIFLEQLNKYFSETSL